MIGDTFSYKDVKYTLKRNVSFGEFKRISKLGNSLLTLTKEFETASEERQAKITEEFTSIVGTQLEDMTEFIESMLEIKVEDIDGLDLFDAIGLFNEAFTLSTQVKKNSKKTSD